MPDPALSDGPQWKLLVVDDDHYIHDVTRLALTNFSFMGSTLTMLHAYSANEARAILERNPDIAVVLLDVVMETDDAGLQLIHIIREELLNSTTRIILRTGQPGQAPEWDIINRYDINDYKSKTELTQTRLFTSLAVTLRTFAQIRSIDTNQRGLEMIIATSAMLNKPLQKQAFAEQLMAQLNTIFSSPQEIAVVALYGINVSPPRRQRWLILAGSGCYAKHQEQSVHDVLDSTAQAIGEDAVNQQHSLFTAQTTVLFINTIQSQKFIVLLNNPDRQPIDQHKQLILQAYCNKVSVVFDNLSLIEQLQHERDSLEQRVIERTSELEQANATLEHLATTDSLTGTYNRRHFMSVAERELMLALTASTSSYSPLNRY